MPIIKSLNIKKAKYAKDCHTTGARGKENNQNMRAVWESVLSNMAHGCRDLTIKYIAKDTGLSISTCRYYFDKLVSVGAIECERR